MMRFAFGYFLVFVAILMFDLLLPGGSGAVGVADLVRMTLVLVVAPVVVSAVAAAIVQQVRPLRMFAPISTGTFGPGAFGFCAAMVVAVSLPFALVWMSPWIGENVIPATMSGVVAATSLVLLAARRPPGDCPRCGYDITHSLEFNRCPECGVDPMTAPTRRNRNERTTRKRRKVSANSVAL
ncbi:MAG: hypothetical protein GXP29_01185 [Planctomycetes bacterium]|nr:hypothetical protein [Planctomycetota bacterium]